MFMLSWEIAVITAAVALSVAVALYWVARPAPATVLPTPDTDSVSFLLEDSVLFQASDAALQLHKAEIGVDNWYSLKKLLSERFPDFPDAPLPPHSPKMMLTAQHPEDAGKLHISITRGFTQIQIEEPATGRVKPERFAGHSELDHLRRATQTAPGPMWEIDNDSQRVIWHNAAYQTLYQKLNHARDENKNPLIPDLNISPSADNRVAVQSSGMDSPDWYDVLANQIGHVTVYSATKVNALVSSEIAQRNFVQTLAKTFAQLSIGLAIFDRNRQLVLFNPALIDLTLLPADFLSGRPALQSFFDRLRENRRMPEPKNYLSWRQEIAKVIAAATDGRYQETWTLESGQTYRVRGRPHPDGAIAFLIEDISAEMSLTRNFRAELELSQSLMDTFDDALAVFSSSGVLTFCNAAYRKMWGLDPESTFADVTIVDSVREWRQQCNDDSALGAITDFIMGYGDRQPWTMPVQMSDNSPLTCHVSPIVSGATVVRFEHAVERVPLTVVVKDNA